MTYARIPAWADNSQARSLLAQIKLEQPDFWIVARHAWTNCRYPKFKGANARALRAMWEAAREAAMDANNRDLWIELGQQHPDDLIDAVLTKVPAELLPENRDRWVA